MKKIIILCIIALAFDTASLSQCGINQKELREKYCRGTYLVHSEVYNTSPEVEIALKKGNKYAFYLLNADQKIKNFILSDRYNKTVLPDSGIFPSYSVYSLIPQTSDTYRFHVNFETDKDACVLWAVYLQNENNLVPGIYRNFEELKYNNPSAEFSLSLTNKSKKYNREDITTYRINIDKRDAKKLEKVFGFSDGKNLYINQSNNSSLRPSTDFTRAESIGNYYYYKVLKSVPVYSGTTVILVQSVDEKLMDINTGEIITLTSRALKDIISDNQQLLTQFENSSHKGRILKEFLMRYMDEKYPE